MPGTIAAVSAPVAPAAGGNTAPVQTSAGTADAKTPTGDSKAPPKVDATKETPKPPEPPRRFKAKAKFDGKDTDLDLEESEVVREIQKARHYDKTRPDFERKVKDFETREKALVEDPLGYLAERGVDLEQLAVAQAQRKAELAKLSPAEQRQAELEQQIEQMKSAETKRLEGEKTATAQREKFELVQSTVRTLDSAIKLSGQKRSGELVKLYAEVMELAEHAGEPSLSPEQLVAAGERLEVKRLSAGIKRAATDAAWRQRNAPMMKELAQAILPTLDGQELIDFVGRDNAVKLARAQLQQYRKNPLPTVAESGNGERTPSTPAIKPPEAPQSMHALLDALKR